MPIPNTVPVGGPVAPYATGDTYNSHFEQYGQGGYRAVADNTERDAITVLRRKEGMLVYVTATGLTWQLQADLTSWVEYAPSGIVPTDIMLKSVYDPNDDGIVTNSDQLQGSTLAQVKDRSTDTGVQAISTVSGLQAALDAKIESALIGIANGLVPTNGSNKIDNSYLDFSLPLDPVIAWDVVGNVPSISDAGGTAGEVYIVYGSANPTARDLGSGSIDWYDGDVVLFDSGTSAFVRIAAYTIGVAQVTTALGVQTGNVVIDDTSYIDPSTDRNYVTDDIEAGLNASPNPITAANPAASMADLTSVIVVGDSVFMPELFADGQTLGNGVSRTLASLGYNNTTAGNYWTRVNSAYTIDVNTMTIDWIAWQEACLAMEQQGFQSITTPSGRGYMFNQSCILPFDQTAIAAPRRSKWWKFDYNCSAFTGNNIRIFDKYPANQAQANGLQLDYGYIFSDGNFYGGGTANETDCAIRLGGTTHSSMTNMKADAFGIAFDFQFCLETKWNEIVIGDYGLYGVRLGDGMWSGASTNIAQSNIAQFNIIRFVAGSGKTATAALYCNGNQNIITNLATFEGNNGSVHHLLYNNLEATTTKYLLVMRDTYFEAAGASRAAVRVISNSGFMLMDGYSIQGSNVNLPVLLEVETVPLAGPAAQMSIKIQNQPQWTIDSKLRQIGQQRWACEDIRLPNNASFIAPENWDLTLPNSSIPVSYRYTPAV